MRDCDCDCDWARSYSPPASPFGRCLGVCFPSSASSSSFSPSCFWAQNFLLAAFMKPCHAFSWQLTHVADARQGQVKQAKLVRHKDAAGIGSIVVGIVFVLRQDVPLCGGGSTEERGSWQTRIITDQISDISRGMNVLWCVFYFISLSYNPPANGAHWGWWQWCIFHATLSLSPSLSLLVRVFLGTHGCRSARRRLS